MHYLFFLLLFLATPLFGEQHISSKADSNKNEKKRILITGSAGFIGFHLAKHLQNRGDDVIGIDNFNNYYSSELKKDRAKLLVDNGVKIVEGDILDQALLTQLILTEEITHIVHLAAQPGVRYSLTNPQAYISTNIHGFLSVLEACRHHPQIYLTYASSSSVYGNNEKVPFSVEDPTEQQASLYAVTKKTNELMAYTYHHLYHLKVTGLRFFTVYGPWGRPDMAYFLFTKAIIENQSINVYDYYKMSRDFTYIDDIIEGIVAAVDLEADFEIFNLGNNRPETLQTLVETIEETLQKKAILNHLPIQPGDVETTFADIEKSRKILNFSPKTDLKEGISKFIDWYLDYMKKIEISNEIS